MEKINKLIYGFLILGFLYSLYFITTKSFFIFLAIEYILVFLFFIYKDYYKPISESPEIEKYKAQLKDLKKELKQKRKEIKYNWPHAVLINWQNQIEHIKLKIYYAEDKIEILRKKEKQSAN